MQTDDLAAQMVREMLSIPPERWETVMYVNPVLEAIARRYLEKAVAEQSARIAAIEKVRDGYKSQMKFCDIEPLPYFREFVRRIDAALGAERAGKEPPHDR